MIKQVWIVQCDICGKVDLAELTHGQYNETNTTLPKGWYCGHNKEIHLCPECSNVLIQIGHLSRGDNNE